MISRLTLVAGAFVATAIMAFAAGAQTVPPPADPGADVSAQDVAAVPAATPAPSVAPAAQTVTDTVYVLPADEPAVIHVTRQAPQVAAPAAPTTRSAPRHRHRERDDQWESESEGEGD